MHEMPVVMNVVELVDDYARNNDVREVRKVVMEIGEIAMVIPHYFRSFWEPVIEQSEFCKKAELQIDVVPGIGQCRRCENDFNIEKNNGVCPHCGAVEDFMILSGRDVQIREIEVI